MGNYDNLNDKPILYADNICIGEFNRTSIEESPDIVCSEIMKGFKNLGITTEESETAINTYMKGFKNLGITTEESETAINTYIKAFRKLITPEFINQEIWYVKNNPNLSWWRKRKIIKKLKIQLNELKKEDKVND